MKPIWITIFDEGNIDFYLEGAFDNEEAANKCAQSQLPWGKVYKFDSSNILSIYNKANELV